jgi:hypothetical protein
LKGLSVHAVLTSEAMGDHAGVDFVQAGHLRFLQSETAVLFPSQRLSGRDPVPDSSYLQDLCIDDFISLGRVPTSEIEAGSGPDLVDFDRVLQAYAKQHLRGSDAKTWRGLFEWIATGAEVLSSKGWVQRGYVPCGAPLARRGALSISSLRAAKLPAIPAQLKAILASSWTALFAFQRPLMVLLRWLLCPAGQPVS